MASKTSSFRSIGGDVIPTPVGNITLEIMASDDIFDAEVMLLQIAGNLEDRVEPLLASAKLLAEDTQHRFDTETDPDGEPWMPLDEEYLAHKISLGYPDDILHRTGELERTATDPDAYIITEDSISFDTSKLPPYGLLHQTGSGTENAGLASRHRFAARNEEGYGAREGGPHSGQGLGRGNALPARPFLGMSEEVEGKVWDLFDLWFEDATNPGSSLYIHPSGTIQGRTSTGRFSSRIVL